MQRRADIPACNTDWALRNAGSAFKRFTGSTYFWSGMTVGLSSFICGVIVGLVGSGLVLADSENSSVFVRVLVVEIFASAIVLIGLIIGFMQIISSAEF
jgi:V-type H+-transporting ATPase 21kDa proteolipid subunit